MRETRIIMGMPVTLEIVEVKPTDADSDADGKNIQAATDAVFDYFTYIDEKFSTYKPESEIMRINRGELAEKDWSDDMSIIFMLAEETKQRTGGYFDIKKPGAEKPFYDPSGIVKGWAIWNAAQLLKERGFKDFYIDAGGDIQTSGINADGKAWSVGIKNPLKSPARGEADEIVKVVYASGDAEDNGLGIATSGTYIRGSHIYDPKTGKPANENGDEIVSLTIIGPNVYEADRFATAAFAMGSRAIHFIESLPGFEGYMIDKKGTATMTSGFEKFTK